MDTNFFNIWTNSMSWVLGFLYADGWLSTNNSFHIELKNKQTIQKIKILTQHKNKIIKIRKKTRIYYRLSFTNKKAYNDLIQLGLTPKKSWIMKFPKVPNNYLRNFIMGYFEGDGCFYYIKNYYNNEYEGNLMTSFTSCSLDFLKVLEEKLSKLGFNPQKTFQNSKKTAFELRISGCNFPKWLYQNYEEIYSKQKYNKFVNIQNKLTNKINKKKFFKDKHFGLKTEFKKGHIPWNKGNKEIGGVFI